MSRDELLTRVWGYDRSAEIETRTVDIHIAKLRRKIEPDAKEPRNLITVRGAGYRLVVERMKRLARSSVSTSAGSSSCSRCSSSRSRIPAARADRAGVQPAQVASVPQHAGRGRGARRAHRRRRCARRSPPKMRARSATIRSSSSKATRRRTSCSARRCRRFPSTSAVPGVLGYFQVDCRRQVVDAAAAGRRASTAASYGITPAEEAARARSASAELRAAARAESRSVRGGARRGRRAAPRPLDADSSRSGRAAECRAPSMPTLQPPSNEDVAPAAAPPAEQAQAAFDQAYRGVAQRAARRARELSAGGARRAARPSRGRLEAQPPRRLSNDGRVVDQDASGRRRAAEARRALVAEPAVDAGGARGGCGAPAKAEVAVRTFASEIDPFELGALDTGHLVLFRNVWRDGPARYVQGALLDREPFVADGRRGAVSRQQPSAGVQRISTVAFQGTFLDTSRPPPPRLRVQRGASSRARCCTARGCRRRSATSSSRSSSTALPRAPRHRAARLGRRDAGGRALRRLRIHVSLRRRADAARARSSRTSSLPSATSWKTPL